MTDVASPNTTTVDLATSSVRSLNTALHAATSGSFVVTNPQGAHAVAAGINAPLDVRVDGSVGYYCAGMHQHGTVTVDGNASTGLAENMMSGTVRITGNATMSAGATGVGGLLVVQGNAGARCGISMKGIDIVVGGDIGHMSAFMAQAGRLVVLGDAADDLGDSIYEAEVYVRGAVASLGSDCEEKPMEAEHVAAVAELLAAAGLDAEPASFRRYGSARRLYSFHVDDIDAEIAARETDR
ncbi:MAG: protein glxC [Actinomycetota bacterium]